MLKRLIFIGLFSILSISIFGQGKVTIKEEKLSDLIPRTLYKSNQVGFLYKVADSEYEAIGHKGEKIKVILKNDDVAYKEFKKFERKAKTSKILYWLSVTAPIAFIASIDYDNDSEKDIRRKAIITGIIYAGDILLAYSFYKNAPKHLYNAVEIYNQNLE